MCTYFLKKQLNGFHSKLDFYNFLKEKFEPITDMFTYLSLGFNNWPERIGESIREKRVCRFCGAKGKKLFKDDAHAIPHSLGNRLLFCLEECNKCNHTLNNIEDNFIHLMDIRRCFYKIPRKESSEIPNVDGLNFAMRPNKNGECELYLMKELLEKECIDYSKPFTYKLVGRPIVSNEGIFKALSKIVLDLLPSNEIEHFKQTIRWIDPNDNFIPDRLPKYISFHLTNGNFFQQPEVEIFLFNKKNPQKIPLAPYCTAILYIYDMAYAFVVPLVDADKGFFKYDINLKPVWRFISYWINLLYGIDQVGELHDATDWWEAYTWAYWDIDPHDGHTYILSRKNPIFNKCFEKDMMLGEVRFKPYNQCLSIIWINTSFSPTECHDICNHDLIDITQHIGVLVVLDIKKNLIAVTLHTECYDTTDKILFFKINSEVIYQGACLNEHVSFKHNQIDSKLINQIFDNAMIDFDKSLYPKVAGTVLNGGRLTKLIKDHRLKENITVHIGSIVSPKN